MRATESPTGLDGRTVELLLTAATAAPSVHNSQPWQFAVSRRGIDLFADTSRQLAVADVAGRSLLISCGAALFNLRVACDQEALHARVRVLPDRTDPTLVATVEVEHRHDRPGPLADLYEAIPQRRTNRYPFFSRAIPRSVVSRLAEAVTAENAVLRVYDDPQEVDRIVRLLQDAEYEERDVPGFAVERAEWVGSTRPGEGIPARSLGPRPAEPRTAYRDLGQPRLGDEPRPLAPFEKTPTIAVLSTVTDTAADWVRAGQALERALLVATGAGLSASFMNQPIEHPDLRWLVRSPTTGHGYPQMLMRLGYGGPVPATPRRPLADTLRSPR